jgi:hypothetical protein
MLVKIINRLKATLSVRRKLHSDTLSSMLVSQSSGGLHVLSRRFQTLKRKLVIQFLRYRHIIKSDSRQGYSRGRGGERGGSGAGALSFRVQGTIQNWAVN